MSRRGKNAHNRVDQKKQWSVAVYIRLSKEDGNDVSYSVINQQEKILRYLDELDDNLDVFDIFIDDGFTGTDSDRDGFQKMISLIEVGKVNCVIVKDLSRLSRNYIEAGQYLELYFVQKNIRFISIELPSLDSYKHPESMDSIMVPIHNIFNDNFARETSQKIRSTFATKKKNGDFIGAFAPYGYAKDPKNKNHLVIDEDAANIVRMIYDLYACKGFSKRGIAKHLNDLGIPNPTSYKRQKGLNYKNDSEIGPNSYWQSRTIYMILCNRMYIGDMVQGKQKVKSYKVHTRVAISEDEWCIVEGTHDPIIELDLFNRVQDMMQRDTKTTKNTSEVTLFAGYVRCPSCQRAMRRKSSKGKVYYCCRTYHDNGKTACTPHSISETQLYDAVLCSIQKHIDVIIGMDDIVRKLNEAGNADHKSKNLENLLRAKEQELEKAKRAKAALYMDMKNGEIEKTDYTSMMDIFSENIAELERVIENITKEIDNAVHSMKGDHPVLLRFRKLQGVTELNRDMLTAVIEMIYINEDKSIHIKFAFEDHFKRMAEFIENNGDLLKPQLHLA